MNKLYLNPILAFLSAISIAAYVEWPNFLTGLLLGVIHTTVITIALDT